MTSNNGEEPLNFKSEDSVTEDTSGDNSLPTCEKENNTVLLKCSRSESTNVNFNDLSDDRNHQYVTPKL